MADEAGESNETKTISVEIDGEAKTLTAEEVANLAAQQASATQQTQKAAAALKAAERYGVDVDTYLENAEGSFALMNSLIESGVIDQQGNVLIKKTEAEPKPKEGDKDFDPPPMKKSSDKIEETAMKAILDQHKDEIQQRLDKIESSNILIMKLRLQDQAMSRHDNLEEEDVARIFTVAEKDPSKTFAQHAEDYSKSKAENRAKLEAEFAQKHGIDLEEAEKKKVFEQDPAGGAATLFTGKKLSFKRGEKDAVTPFQATKEFLSKI